MRFKSGQNGEKKKEKSELMRFFVALVSHFGEIRQVVHGL